MFDAVIQEVITYKCDTNDDCVKGLYCKKKVCAECDFSSSKADADDEKTTRRMPSKIRSDAPQRHPTHVVSSDSPRVNRG